LRLHYGKAPKASQESNMPTDDQDRHRPEPIPSDSIWNPTPVTAKPDRVTYEASRRAELDRIRLIDIKRRQLLRISTLWESMRLTNLGIAMIPSNTNGVTIGSHEITQRYIFTSLFRLLGSFCGEEGSQVASAPAR
jgi:hypothetical protein